MIVYPLAALLNLRFFRQDKAMLVLQNCEREIVIARNRVKNAVKEHESFMVWLAAEEEIRYQAIMERQMTLDDVDEFKSGLLAIRARESLYLEKILKARHHLDKCKQEVATAKKNLLAAQKGTLKIEIHKERWLAIVKQEVERAEERELEDFSLPKNDVFETGVSQ